MATTLVYVREMRIRYTSTGTEARDATKALHRLRDLARTVPFLPGVTPEQVAAAAGTDLWIESESRFVRSNPDLCNRIRADAERRAAALEAELPALAIPEEDLFELRRGRAA